MDRATAAQDGHAAADLRPSRPRRDDDRQTATTAEDPPGSTRDGGPTTPRSRGFGASAPRTPSTPGASIRIRAGSEETTNVMLGVLKRESGRCGRVLKRPFLGDFSCSVRGAGTCLNRASDEHGDDVGVSPAFALKFGRTPSRGHLLAVADEEGFVSLVDTSKPLPASKSEPFAPLEHWELHRNAIFDVEWSHDDTILTTASGDQTLRVWSVEGARKIKTLGGSMGHQASVKSVSYKHQMQDVLASCARDGLILLWDLRVSGPIHRITDAHSYPHKAVTSGRRRRNGISPSVVRNGVTSVLFLRSDHILASAGAGDGLVKFWDTRNMEAPCSLASLPQGEDSASRSYGVTSIAEDANGSKLAVSAYNHKVYLYDSLRPELGPMQTFAGHQNASFYIKVAFSPDGTHVLSGSSDNKGYIWQVDRPEDGAYVVEGHEGEVSGVAWCPHDFCKIATCSDDATFRIWNVDRRWPTPARKMAPPPVVRLRGPLTPLDMNRLTSPGAGGGLEAGARGGAGDERSPKSARCSYRLQEAQVDCTDIGGAFNHGSSANTQNYRNATLTEIWGGTRQ